MSDFKVKLGNFLYKKMYFLYKPLYYSFKRKQDKFEIKLLKEHIKQGDTVLDIGANIGFYAVILSEIVGDMGKVCCFEPDETNFKRLKNNCQKKNNIHLFNKAVGERSGKINIYLSSELNVDHRTYEPEKYDSLKEIDSVSIDDFLPDEKIDFVKIDIQGFEPFAVKGMINTVTKNSKIKMITEFWPYGLKRSGSSALDYFSLLKSMGFIIYLMESDKLNELNEEKVLAMQHLPVEKYFNVFLSRVRV